MYTSNELTLYAFRSILSHLVEIEESKNEIVNGIYNEPSTLRDDFKCFLDYYIKRLEDLMKTVQIVDKPSREELKTLNYLPYVIIGSTVDLENVNNLNNHSFKIVSPYDPYDSKENLSCLSCLSALGKSLMLNKPGDIIKTKLNGDECLYKIKSIQYN